MIYNLQIKEHQERYIHIIRTIKSILKNNSFIFCKIRSNIRKQQNIIIQSLNTYQFIKVRNIRMSAVNKYLIKIKPESFTCLGCLFRHKKLLAHVKKNGIIETVHEIYSSNLKEIVLFPGTIALFEPSLLQIYTFNGNANASISIEIFDFHKTQGTYILDVSRHLKDIQLRSTVKIQEKIIIRDRHEINISFEITLFSQKLSQISQKIFKKSPALNDENLSVENLEIEQLRKLLKQERQKNMVLEQENYELKENRLIGMCKVCYDNNATHLNSSCGHLCVCQNCASRLHRCPLCNTERGKFIKLFSSQIL